jgi:drug/metabolite transporter (DMT)-like permease
VDTATAIALPVALVSTILTNVAYLIEHDAAAALPKLSLRQPIHSAKLLVENRAWMKGFVLESMGFGLYVVAVALASLALVQSVGAGGIGVLAVAASRVRGQPLTRRERWGASLAGAGLFALGISLIGGSGSGGSGSTGAILLWLGASAAAAALVVAFGRGGAHRAAAAGIAGGLCFSIGDISTKAATQGGMRVLFAVTIVLGYAFGTGLLQIGYQSGGALTVAGIATLLTNALPIAAGSIVFDESIPAGFYGAARIFAFAAVTIGAFLLARPRNPSPTPAAAAA